MGIHSVKRSPHAIPQKPLDSAIQTITVCSPVWKFVWREALCQIVSWLPTTCGCEIPVQFSCMPSLSFCAAPTYFRDTLFFLSCRSLSTACTCALRPTKSVGSRCWHSCCGQGWERSEYYQFNGEHSSSSSSCREHSGHIT